MTMPSVDMVLGKGGMLETITNARKWAVLRLSGRSSDSSLLRGEMKREKTFHEARGQQPDLCAIAVEVSD